MQARAHTHAHAHAHTETKQGIWTSREHSATNEFHEELTPSDYSHL